MKHVTFHKVISLLTTVALVAVLALLPVFGPGNANSSKASAQSLAKYKKNALRIKLNPASGIYLNNGVFAGGSAEQTSQLNNLLASKGKIKAEKLGVNSSRTSLQQKIALSIDSYYKVSFDRNIDMNTALAQLKALGVVETAYAEATPAPSPTASYTGLQKYLTAAPAGIDSTAAKAYAGGRGNNVKIVDIEYSWNTDHEDLSKARTALVPNGTPSDPFNDKAHGTAVLGEMIADENSYGISGAAPGASLTLINANNLERGYDPVGALNTAAGQVMAGDVIIIEQQTWGPTSRSDDYVPLEWLPEVYDVIKTLTANGITVVEAGGNGSQNLDDTNYYGSQFPMGKPDSGAIIVGAGENCNESTRLSRISFSNYGKRVNLQGPGNCVTSTGLYGDLYASNGVNAYYTSAFSGTSSASPVVASAAAVLSSVSKSANSKVLTPFQIRDILSRNSTAQSTGTGMISGQIGPYPDLAKALREITQTDTTAPSMPQNLKVILNKSGQPVLSWNASTDNVKVASYKIYRNGVFYANTNSTSFTDTATSRRTNYTYRVAAVDLSNNISAQSTAVSIRTR